MKWSRKRKADLVADLDLLINDLCVIWGFCNQLRAHDLISLGETLDADTFACAVLKAEGLNPATSQYRKPISRKFIERYGPTVSKESHSAAGYAFE